MAPSLFSLCARQSFYTALHLVLCSQSLGPEPSTLYLYFVHSFTQLSSFCTHAHTIPYKCGYCLVFAALNLVARNIQYERIITIWTNSSLWGFENDGMKLMCPFFCKRWLINVYRHVVSPSSEHAETCSSGCVALSVWNIMQLIQQLFAICLELFL